MKKKLLHLSSVILMTGIFVLPVQAQNVDQYPDLHPQDWYYEYVKDVTEKDLMTGYDDGSFGAVNDLARGEFATILYRMDGSPQISFEPIYPDVTGSWFYSEPVTWANKEQIITGYENGNFGPADKITREQVATIMYRYAKTHDQNLSAHGDYSVFPDGNNVSPFASEAMRWAIGEGIIKGNDNGTLDPQGNVSRAVCATIISRYVSDETENDESSSIHWTFSDGENGALTKRNDTLSGLTYASAHGPYPIVAPDEGINWERDVLTDSKTYSWYSKDDNATDRLHQAVPWKGDTQGALPPEDSDVYQVWLKKGNGVPFNEWFHTWFEQIYFYSVDDPYAKESIQKLGIDMGAFGFQLCQTSVTEDEFLSKRPPASNYPHVTVSDITVPPVNGAVLVWISNTGKVIPFNGEYIVSYSVYGGTEQWANTTQQGQLAWGIKTN